MKKPFLGFVLSLFFTTFLWGQQEGTATFNHKKAATPPVKIRLSGKITDLRSGEPLPGASVYLTDDKIGAIANINGSYSIMNVPDGHHIIEVSHTGYSPQVTHIELTRDTEMDFALSPVILENQEVIVTGVSSGTSSRKATVPVSTIKKPALLQSAATNIIDALTRMPGVAQLSTGPAISKPFIRGLGYNRVVTINEGVRQEGQQWGDEHGIEIDELSVSKVEILKGPASLMYGSDALAGVINFITHVPVTEGALKGNILGHHQTNNGLWGVHGNLAGNKNGLNWNLYTTYKSAGDYRNTYDGRVLNSRFNELNYGGYIGINKSWGYSHLVVSRFDQQVGLVEGERDDASGRFVLYGGTAIERVATDQELESRKLFVPRQRVQHNKIVSDNNLAIGKSRLKINVGYQENIRQEFGEPVNPRLRSLYFDLASVNYNIQWQLPEIKEWHTSLGVNGMHQQHLNKGEEVLIPEYRLFDAGLFAFTQRFFNKATLSGGLRIDNRQVHSKEWYQGTSLHFEKFERSFTNFSGSVGISYEPSATMTLKANVARGFRAPTLSELASNGAHEGTNRYEYGERGLGSETSLQFDAGIDLNYEHFHIGIATFYNLMDNFIFYRKLLSVSGGDSIVQVNGEDIPAFKFNQQNAGLYGVEVSIDIHPHPLDWLHFENSFSFVRGRFDSPVDGSRNMPLIPAPRITSELRGDFIKSGKWLRNLYAKTGVDITFKQEHAFTGFGTETPTQGYVLCNAGLGSEIVNTSNQTICSVHFSVSNLTNVAYQSHLGRLKYAAENRTTGRQGVFNSGRNFSLKLNLPIDFRSR